MRGGAKPRIPISVVERKQSAMTPTDAVYLAFRRLNDKASSRTDSHASPVGSGLLPRRDDGLHHVARGESVNSFLARQVAAREAVLVDPRALITPPSGAADFKNAHALEVVRTVDLTRAERIKPMLFRNAEGTSIEFRQRAGTPLHGKTECLERIEKRLARCVDCRRARERTLALLL